VFFGAVFGYGHGLKGTPGHPSRASSCIAMAFATVPAPSDRDAALIGRNLNYDTPGKICSSIDFCNPKNAVFVPALILV